MTKATNHSKVDFVEVFSPPRVAPFAKKLGLKVNSKIYDLTSDWDVRKLKDRHEFRQMQRELKPKMIMYSPVCKAFSQMMNVNWERMDANEIQKIKAEGLLMWNFSLQSAEEQLENDDYFGLEHPSTASSWDLPQTQRLTNNPEVAEQRFLFTMKGQVKNWT